MNFLCRHKILLSLCCVFLSVVFTACVCAYALTETAAETEKLTVVVDAGHGGIDGGVVGTVIGTKESDINLLIAQYLKTKLEEAGFRVVMTRNTSSGLYGAAVKGYKKRDMKKRAEIIHASSPSAVVSVHQNFFSDSSRRGAQVFYRADSSSSKTLACMLQSSFNQMEECVEASEPLAGDYYILNCSNYPSVIAECGFLSNREDEALLVTSDYQNSVAEAIFKGVIAFLSYAADGTN